MSTPPTLRQTTRRAARLNRSGGFTLLELLIVVGIIAVLVSILLPVRGRIRERAQLINCQANLRQLYQATLQYVSNNDGYLMGCSLAWETPANNGKNCCWAMAQPAIADLHFGTLWPYVGDTTQERGRAVWCPSDINESARGGGAVGNENRNFSYSFNCWIRPYTQDSTKPLNGTIKLTRVAQPAKRVMIYEEFAPNDAACYGPSDSADWLTGRHGGENTIYSDTSNRGIYNNTKWKEIGQGNVCYFDGHVGLMTVQHYFADPSHFFPLTQ